MARFVVEMIDEGGLSDPAQAYGGACTSLPVRVSAILPCLRADLPNERPHQRAQFTSDDRTKEQNEAGVANRMQGKRRSIDNAVIEQTWRNIKYAEVSQRAGENASEERTDLTQCLMFCNTRRFHTAFVCQRPSVVYIQSRAASTSIAVEIVTLHAKFAECRSPAAAGRGSCVLSSFTNKIIISHRGQLADSQEKSGRRTDDMSVLRSSMDTEIAAETLGASNIASCGSLDGSLDVG